MNGLFLRRSLESVVIPASVTTIGKAAFTECKRLSSVTFTGDMNLRTIGAGAFSGRGFILIRFHLLLQRLGRGLSGIAGD